MDSDKLLKIKEAIKTMEENSKDMGVQELINLAQSGDIPVGCAEHLISVRLLRLSTH